MRVAKLFSATVLVATLGWLAFAAPPDDDPFAPANSVDAAKKAKPGDDPFDPGNKVQPGKAPEPEPKKATKVPKTAERIDLTVKVEPQQARRGETVKLTIVGATKPSFYTYPLSSRTPAQDERGLNSIVFAKSAGLLPLWPGTESPVPEFYDTHVVGILLRHTKTFTWTQDILVESDAKPGPNLLEFKINLQVCDEHSCVRGTHLFEATVNVTDAAPVALSAELTKRLAAKQEIKIVPLPAELAKKTPSEKGTLSTTPEPKQTQGFWGIVFASMGSALLMLLTPCVFPMIPITVSFFAKQSEKEHHKPFLLASVYSLTIVIVLSLAVLLLGKVIIDLANSPWMNFALGVIMVYFALSLFGMYEIELPSGLARFTSAREGQGGLIGALFMALTFTITSFSCTGPFLGPLLASVSLLQVNYWTLIVAAFVYSSTFAAPFFVLALFPSLVKKLPRSGSWLNTVKVVMGFVELALALKFLGNTDAAWNPGNPWFFNYDTVLCAWIALASAAGLYLLGFFRLPHDQPVEHISVVRMLLATLFFGLALYLMPALSRETPLGLIGENVRAFLPQDSRPRKASGTGGSAPLAELHWHHDYEKAWQEAVRDNKLMFIDHTGVFCINCRDNEERVFSRPEVRKLLEKFVRVQLYNDIVPTPGLSSSEANRLGLLNRDRQDKTFGDVSTPLYVVFQPAKDKPFTEDGKLNGVAVSPVVTGKIFDNQIPEFVAKLQEALGSQVAERELEWHSDYKKAWTVAVKEKKPLFVAFEGVSNINSRANQVDVLTRPDVQNELRKCVRVELYTDFVPFPGLSEEEATREAERNRTWQYETFANSSNPMYVILHPASDSPYTQDNKLKGTKIAEFSGMILPDRLEQFLRMFPQQSAMLNAPSR